MIAVKTTPPCLWGEPTSKELGELTNRWFNILAKLKTGKYPVQQLLKTLQHVGDGVQIVEEIFSQQHVLHDVRDDKSSSSFACLKELPWVTVKMGGGMSDLTFKALLTRNQPPQKGGSREVFIFARNEVDPEEMMSVIMEAEGSKGPQPKGGLHACLRGRHFSPLQLSEMLEDRHYGQPGQSFKQIALFLCHGLVPDEPVIAEVHWASNKNASIYLRGNFIRRGLANMQLIMKVP